MLGNNMPFGAAIAHLLDGGNTADVIIQALEQRGLARRLAEPNLVALSGDTASFLAGGEFPFPVQANHDKITSSSRSSASASRSRRPCSATA